MAIRSGQVAAVSRLIEALRSPSTTRLHPDIQNILAEEMSPACLDRCWEEWSTHRLPSLEEILLRRGLPASKDSTAWAISLARLSLVQELERAGPPQVESMAHLIQDPDHTIVANSRLALSRLNSQSSQNELFRLWADTRSSDLWDITKAGGFQCTSPPSVRALFFLKANLDGEIIHSPANLVAHLVAALDDPDREIALCARRCLPLLTAKDSINQLGLVWQENRSTILGEIIREGQLIATQPAELRLLMTLQCDKQELARQCAPEEILYLVALLHDPDSQISVAVREALSNLEKPESCEQLCHLAVETEATILMELVLQAGYRPEKPDLRAVFLFLAGLWEEYDAFDFDGRYLRALYETSAAELRQRITRQVQNSGRAGYLSILAGVDLRSNIVRLSSEEIQLVVGLLISNREWPRLWTLIHRVPFSWSVRILQALTTAGWQPDEETDRSDYIHLSGLAADLPIPDSKTLAEVLQPAVAISSARISGRINDLCFSSNRPVVAIGTNSRKLGVWNFKTASLEKVHQGFNHSISRVVFVGDEYLLAGVRSNSNAACWIYGWKEGEPLVLPGHRGAVKVMIPYGNTSLLSFGRDGAMILWNLADRSELARRNLRSWSRTACISADGRQLLYAEKELHLVQLPALDDDRLIQARSTALSGTRISMASCACFLPKDDKFLIGQINGQAILYQQLQGNRFFSRKVVFDYKDHIVGLQYIPSRGLIVTASRDGNIGFHHWPDFDQTASIRLNDVQLTSLHISPEGNFLALGTSESTIQLWDLRVMDLPTLFDQPLENASAESMAALSSVLGSTTIQGMIRRQLELLISIMQRRLRFDIQIDEMPQIQPGEFDIELE